MYTAGESKNLTVFHTAGGNAGARCQCDLDRDLMVFVVANQAALNEKMVATMITTSANPFGDQMSRTFQLDVTVGKTSAPPPWAKA
jgi:hypothetical protein